ncbi:Holliday junction resolvase RuvX [Criibacterium bergeronii]|uniref:Putative pre-16S rRNA nuclease n=1 Tax=Criibacterium bergeronii TaxID=1871336 RepID=A0A371IMF0_9FIRM|nr:Holliday junction resolvase RuvX [Criibacterium bergeronii]MBS6062298.1 Holliday junction resolvase RuvX [Peptostreptococcaceae bacterium]RDY21648.1 Holliday junction resolvase RuvX [Criibacterium bergeronii]TRW28557.1 Holliday junction resolvase RuvX [Criibacterium bergeronii]
MRKMMGLDIGKKKIGIAISDLLGMTAQPNTTIRSKNLDEQIQKILDLIKENDIVDVAVGLPKKENGELGDQAEWTQGFVEKILEKNPNINIHYIDERHTSKMALEQLGHLSMKKIKEKELIDALAAVNILEIYMQKKALGN